MTKYFLGKQRGAVEACSAHNRKDVGSKPTAAIFKGKPLTTHPHPLDPSLPLLTTHPTLKAWVCTIQQ